MDSGISEKDFKKIGVVRWIENINEFESFEHEADAIRTIGRSLIHMGPLVNAIEGTQFTGGYQKVQLSGFSGMNHVGNFAMSLTSTDKSGSMFAVPRIILNSTVNTRGQLVRRKGRRKLIPLENSRCLWSCPLCMLVVADERITPTSPLTPALFRIQGDSAQRISSIDLPAGEFVFAVQLEDKVIISTKDWNSIFNPNTGAYTNVGFDVPVYPFGFPTIEGNLAPGVYRFCITNGDGVNYGSPSPLATVVLDSVGGITVPNLSPGQDVWITDCNGDTLFRSASGGVISDISTADPLKTLGSVRSFPMTHLAHTCGRLLGAVGNRLYFTPEYRYDIIFESSYFEFSENIRMIAPVNTISGIGVYVGLESRTIFLSGASPTEMREFSVGYPVVEGTLAYCQNVPNLGNNIPVWIARDGAIIGAPNGALQNVTFDKLKLLPGIRGASAFRVCDGSFQYIASFKRDSNGSGVGFGDSATCDVVRNGKVI